MRDTVEDVVLPSYNSDGSKGQIAVERGVCVAVDMVGLRAYCVRMSRRSQEPTNSAHRCEPTAFPRP